MRHDETVSKQGHAKKYGIAFGMLAAIGLIVPGSYLVESAGPALDITKSYDDVELVKISGAPTYPSETNFYMTTVSVFGSPDMGVTGAQAVFSLVSPNQQLIPLRAMYPKSKSSEQVKEENAVAMTNSQDSGTVAGLEAAGLKVSMKLTVSGAAKGSPAAEVFEKGDVIRSITAGGVETSVESFSDLSSVLFTVAPKTDVTIGVLRDGVATSLSVQTLPYEPDSTGFVHEGSQLGIFIQTSDISFPADVTYGVKDIGGPSAGSMFALAIYDRLTDGSLGGNNSIAGTGTMSYNGDIGPIGGIRHKMHGAAEQGATYFLAPAVNCNEVVGNVPKGMKVFAVRNLDESIAASKAIGAGKTQDLNTCEQVLGSK